MVGSERWNQISRNISFTALISRKAMRPIVRCRRKSSIHGCFFKPTAGNARYEQQFSAKSSYTEVTKQGH